MVQNNSFREVGDTLELGVRSGTPMSRERFRHWCEGCLHPIGSDDPHVVLAMKHIPDCEHEVLFHRACFFPGHPLYTEIPSHPVSQAGLRARQPRPPRRIGRRQLPPPSVRAREKKTQIDRQSIRLQARAAKPKSTALLEITGSDGSARRLPCRATFGAPWVSVQLYEDVVLERGISYRMILLKEDGARIEGVTAFEADSGLLRPVSVSSLGFLFDSSQVGGRSV
jgi:hypothetical protein